MDKRELIHHLICEVSAYVLKKEPMRMVVSLHQEEDGFHLAIIDDNTYSDDEIKDIEKAFNSEKRPELAGYYGEMTGQGFFGNFRLDLLGWKVKHADIKRVNKKGININLWMGSERFQSDKFTIPSIDD
ncbi:MAG: hypothetical protein MJB14_16860 [Spirochaetes bacterium]|nr:hypothetical protein [Spirochaetota bacterium]